MPKTLAKWIADGEELYAESLREYRELEKQLAQMETTLAAKRQEVNRIAQAIGKPPIESHPRLVAELVDEKSVPNSHDTIARVLSGRGLGR